MDDFERADSFLDDGRGKEAMAIFHKLAENGRVDAMHAIAHTHLYGIAGVPRDYHQAFHWFTQAADRGCPQAMYHLGMCNATGFGTPVQPVKAFKWYQNSAGLGDEDAEYRVGDCFERGFGVEKNLAEAIRHYRSAAQKGQAEAIQQLQKLGVSA